MFSKYNTMKKQKSVFEFGNEYIATQFWSTEANCSGVDISNGDEHIGSILDIEIPEIDDEDANIDFDRKVVDWVIDNELN